MNCRSDIAIIRAHNNDEVSTYLKNRGYKVYGIYKGDRNLVLRNIRKFWMKYNLPLMSIWYQKPILSDTASYIMVFETLTNRSYMKWLREKKRRANIVVWYWNVVSNTINPNEIKDYCDTVWSFSRVDCEKYNMKFNPPPYFKEKAYLSEHTPVDVCFVGRDKGRLQGILECKELFERYGLTTEFHITPTYAYETNINYSPTLTYEQSIKVNARAKAILDYIEVDNSGQSMRVMEALFTHKKIITNSKLIVDYDFYNKDNYFILGVDDYENLPRFVRSPYIDCDEQIKERYDFDRFIERFWCQDADAWWEQ